jgi:hypothetical protein
MQTKPPFHNVDDYATVCVCFHEHLISYLFADLLEARGVPTKIVRHLDDPCNVPRIITEPSYYDLLPLEQQGRCLIVGTTESLAQYDGRGAHTLSRPLSEDKINSALKTLFANLSSKPILQQALDE